MAGLGFVLGLLGIGLGYPGQPHVVNSLHGASTGWFSPPPRATGSDRLGLDRLFRDVGVGMEQPNPPILAWTTPRSAFVVVANQLFHPLIAGILVASVLSAIMSTADSQLLVAGSAVTYDLKLGGDSQRTLLFRSRLVILNPLAGSGFGGVIRLAGDIFSGLVRFQRNGICLRSTLIGHCFAGPCPVRPKSRIDPDRIFSERYFLHGPGYSRLGPGKGSSVRTCTGNCLAGTEESSISPRVCQTVARTWESVCRIRDPYVRWCDRERPVRAYLCQSDLWASKLRLLHSKENDSEGS